MIDGSVLQSAQRCFEKKSRVVVKMVVSENKNSEKPYLARINSPNFACALKIELSQSSNRVELVIRQS